MYFSFLSRCSILYLVATMKSACFWLIDVVAFYPFVLFSPICSQNVTISRLSGNTEWLGVAWMDARARLCISIRWCVTHRCKNTGIAHELDGIGHYAWVSGDTFSYLGIQQRECKMSSRYDLTLLHVTIHQCW